MNIPPDPELDAAGAEKPYSKIALGIGVALVLAGAVSIGWYFHRTRQDLDNQFPPPPPVNSSPAPVPPVEPAPLPRVARAPKPARAKPAPVPHVDTAAAPTLQIASLTSQARDAYARGNYALPLDSSAIAYSKKVLALDPTDGPSKRMIEDSVKAGKDKVAQALGRGDFAGAQRLADALAQLLPGRSDVTGLKDQIAAAQRAAAAVTKPKSAGPPLLAFRLYHMHSDKAPADKGPYCLGTMSVGGSHFNFAAESTSDGKVHNLEFSCSEIRDIKKNARVASHQGGFHIRTHSGNFNFAPQDSSVAVVPALNTACSN